MKVKRSFFMFLLISLLFFNIGCNKKRISLYDFSDLLASEKAEIRLIYPMDQSMEQMPLNNHDKITMPPSALQMESSPEEYEILVSEILDAQKSLVIKFIDYFKNTQFDTTKDTPPLPLKDQILGLEVTADDHTYNVSAFDSCYIKFQDYTDDVLQIYKVSEKDKESLSSCFKEYAEAAEEILRKRLNK